MMRTFTTGELGRMQNTQEGAMMDICVILSLSTTVLQDEYGYPIQPWLEGATTVCGLDPDPKPEWNVPSGAGDRTQVEAGEARLRLPIDTEISNLDRVRITHRFGSLLETPVEYELIDTPRRGPSGLVARLRKVTHA